MAKRDQAEEISRAADRFAESAQELTATLNRLLEFQERAWDQLEGSGLRSEGLLSLVHSGEYPNRGGLSEAEAVQFALAVDRDVRREWSPPSEREERLPAPSSEEVRKRREERRRREDAEDRS